MSLPVPSVPSGVSQQDARLAWELVANISPIGDIMRRHGLTFDGYDAKLRDPLFKTMLEEYRRHWNSDLTVNQRVSLKAALLTEDSLLDVYQIIKDVEATAGQKLEAFGALAKAGEVGTQRRSEVPGGPLAHVTINIPGQRGITIDAMPTESSDD